MQRQLIPSLTFGNHCSNSCHFSFSLRSINQAGPPPFSVLLPSNLSQDGEKTAQLPGKVEASHGAEWKNMRHTGLGLAPSPCHPGLHSWAWKGMWAWRWTGSATTPGTRVSAMGVGWCWESRGRGKSTCLFVINLFVHSY